MQRNAEEKQSLAGEQQKQNSIESGEQCEDRREMSFDKQRRLDKVSIFRVVLTLIITAIVWMLIQNTVTQLLHFRLAAQYPFKTVAIPRPPATYNYSKIIENQKKQFESELLELLKPFNDTDCKLLKVGESLVCQNLLKRSIALVNIGDNVDFGCKLIQTSMMYHYFYGCQSENMTNCHSNLSAVSSDCLGQYSEVIGSKNYISLVDLIHKNGLKDDHLVLKIQLKEYSWEVFRSLPQRYLDKIDQMILRVHLNSGYQWGTLDIFKSIQQKYYPLHLKMDNQHCNSEALMLNNRRRLGSSVFQILFVNKNILKINSQNRSFDAIVQQIHNVSENNCQMLNRDRQIILRQMKPLNLTLVSKDEQHLHKANKYHIHLEHQQTYQTLGVPTIGNFFDGTRIQQFDRQSFYKLIARVFKPYQATNCDYGSYGEIQNFIICKNFLNMSTALIDLGSEGWNNFGCQLTSEFNMPNFIFLPKDKKCGSYCVSNNNLDIFEQASVGDKSEIMSSGQLYLSLKDIIDSRGLNGSHVTLKIDLRGRQWSALRSLPISYLQFIDQIVMKVHLSQPFAFLEGNKLILEHLQNQFYPINLHMDNRYCWQEGQASLPSRVFDVTLVNIRLLDIKRKKRTFKLNRLNQPSRHDRQDCQL